MSVSYDLEKAGWVIDSSQGCFLLISVNNLYQLLCSFISLI